MKSLPLVLALALAAQAFSQDRSVAVGHIDFYGHAGLAPDRLRAALPVREGDRLSPEAKEQTVDRIKQAITQAAGRAPTDVATICCDDRGRLVIYVGLPGASVRQIRYNPAPRGSARLPPAAIKAYREADQAWSDAMRRGVYGEDDSRGYALSLDPEARAKQLALHTYAARHAARVRRVLESARDAGQRRIAAEVLGYAGLSRAQVRALARAGRDVDDGVRNNALRALGVLARSSARAAALIPADGFVEMLNSGTWSDRNKSAGLLSTLTARRDPQLLGLLRARALSSLVEMARWHFPGHADGARLMLGRIAGVEEKSLAEMVARGEIEPIISAVTTQRR